MLAKITSAIIIADHKHYIAELEDLLLEYEELMRIGRNKVLDQQELINFLVREIKNSGADLKEMRCERNLLEALLQLPPETQWMSIIAAFIVGAGLAVCAMQIYCWW
jgi:hypothetical protein